MMTGASSTFSNKRSALCRRAARRDAAAALCVPSFAVERKDEAGLGAVGEQLAGTVAQPSLGGGDPPAAVDDAALADAFAGRLPDRPRQAHLEFDRRVAFLGRERRMHGAAERRIEKRGRPAAVDRAER